MRLSISNIGWDPGEDEDVAKLLRQRDINAIDIAPGKYFPAPGHTTGSELASVKAWWSDRGFEIVGMQSLLFGTTGLNLFGDSASQEAMLRHLDHVCRIGGALNATRLVFGSPKNRDRSGLSDSEALRIAVPFFRKLGDIARSHGVIICLEPNPDRYGANFMTTSSETAAVVRRVDHPAIKMQLDTGSLALNGEAPGGIIPAVAPVIGHIHASEPDLLPLGDADTDHRSIAGYVAQSLAEHIVTIEMRATEDEPHLASIERALNVAIDCYRRQPGKAAQ